MSDTPRNLEEYYEGKGCICGAYSYSECACGVDWTDPRIYELERELAEARELLNRSDELLAKWTLNYHYEIFDELPYFSNKLTDDIRKQYKKVKDE